MARRMIIFGDKMLQEQIALLLVIEKYTNIDFILLLGINDCLQVRYTNVW